MKNIVEILNAGRISNSVLFVYMSFFLVCCDQYKDGFIFGAPASGMLMSEWQLDSIFMPNQKVSGTNIGYSETLTIKGENGYRIERTLRDDSLINSQYWVARMQPVIDEKQMTFYVNYRSGLKRFYKVYARTSAPNVLEATGYVNKIGGSEDSIRYFYTEVWK